MEVVPQPDPKRSYDAEPKIHEVVTEEARVRRARREPELAYPERPGR